MAQEKIEYEERIRELLGAIRSGDREAFTPLLEAVGTEIRKLSAFRLRQSGGRARTLQTTALVNEVVLRLLPMVNRPGPKFPESRLHLLALASRLMRCSLADHARKKRVVTVELAREQEQTLLDGWSPDDLEAVIAFHQSIEEMGASGKTNGALRGQALELHIFGGCNYHEIAAELNISDDTARRYCQTGIAKLREAMSRP